MKSPFFASGVIGSMHASSLKFASYFAQYGVDQCNQCQAGMALFSNYKTNAAFDKQNVSTTTLVNYSWTCAASSFVQYLNQTSSWDTKTNKNSYLYYYNYMCSQYTIATIAAGTGTFYMFKYDALNTYQNTLSGTSYQISSSNRQTYTNGGAVFYALQCSGCANNYVLSHYKDYCYPNTLLQNCKVAFDYNDCKTCNTNFARIRVPSDTDSNVFVAQCVNMTIPNCSLVDNENLSNSDVPLCKTCSNGHYWNSTLNQCLPSNTQNCAVNTSIN